MKPLKIGLHEAVATLLARGEPLSNAQLAAATGKSQSSISLALGKLGERVHRIGAARSTRYGLKKNILELPAQQPIIFTNSAGHMKNWGVLTHLHNAYVACATPEGDRFGPSAALPWFLTPLRPQGFLGRQYASYRQDFPSDPDQWSLTQIVYMAARHAHNAPGAFDLGSPGGRLIDEVSPHLAERLLQYDTRAVQVSHSLPAGSSAGGEQPKFLTEHSAGEGWQHCIVKYTPPHGTPFGDRWRVLLLLEELALRTLSLHGVDTAPTQVLHSTERTYLESERFDRIGMHGKHHVVAIAAVHDEFVGGPWQNWVHTAAALAQKGLITPHELQQVARIFAFGHYIGNTDMHSGNLSFYVDDVIAPKIRLAPVYDMLPMMWRPDIHQGALSDSPVRQQLMPLGFAEQQEEARSWAIEFWEQAGQFDIGADLRDAAKQSTLRLQTRFTTI